MADLWLQFVLTIDATLRVATPLILCAMAGLFSERSGIIDISLEGKMLMSAFAAASMAALTGSPLLGLAGGILDPLDAFFEQCQIWIRSNRASTPA